MRIKFFSTATVLTLILVLSWPGQALADSLLPKAGNMEQVTAALQADNHTSTVTSVAPSQAAGPDDQAKQVRATGRFADPDVRVVESNAQGVVLELVTPDLHAKRDKFEDGYCDLIQLPGYGETNRAGWPRLPVKGAMVAIPPQAKPILTVLEADPGVVSQRYSLCPVPRLDYERDLVSGEVKDKGALVARDATAYSSSSFYPAALAEIVSTSQVRDRHLAQLQFHPFQYNPVSGELKYYRRIRVQVQFGTTSQSKLVKASTSDPFEQMLSQTVVNYDAVVPSSATPTPQAALTDSPASSLPSYKVTVNKDGLYRVTSAELQAAGMDVSHVDPRTLELSNQGQQVAIYVAGEVDGSFDPGDAVFFYGQKMNTRYTDVNVYWLTWGGANGLRMPVLDGTPGGTASVPGYFSTTQHMEQNLYYRSSYPSGPDNDRWYWDYIYASGAPASKSFTTTLQHVATVPLSATVRGLFKGFNATPQHHTQVYLNGRLVDDAFWPPQGQYTFQASVPQAYLLEGTNTISVTCPLDNGIAQDGLYINWFEIDYYRTFVAENSLLAFDGDAAGTWGYQVGGFYTNTLNVFDITDPASPARILNATVTPTSGAYTLTFQQTIAGEHHYIALAPTQMQGVLSIEADHLSNLHAAANSADYIIITHGSFYTDVLPLAAYRTSRGLRTVVVDVQDVYDEFSRGIFDPVAIHDFLAYAYANWTPPAPSYVLLVGDGNWDFKNNLGTGEPNYIPPYLVDVDPWIGEIASDNRYASVSGDDFVPDLYIGRLPVKTSAEASAVVSKILNYEQNPPPGNWNQQVLFPTDNPDGAGNFYWSADALADNDLPAPYTAQKIYYGLTYTDPAQDKAAIISAINEGRLIVNYIGHAGIQQWASEQLFTAGDVATLSNAGRLPLVVTMACYDGYFTYPSAAGQDFSSTSETLLRAPGKGAIATWAATGLGLDWIQDLLNWGLYQAVFYHDVTRIGPATTMAKLYLYNSIGYNHEMDSYTLFGDPALELNVLRTDLSITQSVDAAGLPRPGDTLTYTLTYSNVGPATAHYVVMSDALPTMLINPTVVSTGAAITARAGSHFVWDVADLAAGSGGIITVTGVLYPHMPVGSAFTNTVTLTTTAVDANPGNNSSAVAVTASDKTICSLATDAYRFNLTETVQVAITTLGTLDCLTVERFDTHHISATQNIQTGQYWRITGVDRAGRPANGFSLTLTLPTAFIPNAYTQVCRYTGVDKVWDCAATGYDDVNGTVTRSGITAPSDWAVGNDTPSAVTLREFKVGNKPGHMLPLGLIVIGLGLVPILARKKRVTGFEPATHCLGSSCATTALHPRTHDVLLCQIDEQCYHDKSTPGEALDHPLKSKFATSILYRIYYKSQTSIAFRFLAFNSCHDAEAQKKNPDVFCQAARGNCSGQPPTVLSLRAFFAKQHLHRTQVQVSPCLELGIASSAKTASSQ